MAVRANRKKQVLKMGDEDLVHKLMPSWSKARQNLKFALPLMALIIGIIGLANLQKGSKTETVVQKGIDVFFVLDVSESMNAPDLSPNRLEKAKLLIDELIDELSGNRLGLIIFAGRPYISVPLTTDVEALRMNLSLASPEMIGSQGTILKTALETAERSFNQKESRHKGIVLLSDGEDHEQGALNFAEDLKEKGIMICSVGVGSEEGSRIPLDNGSFKKDAQGQEVISKLNAEMLEEIATVTNGSFHRLKNINRTATGIKSQLNEIDARTFGQSRFMNFSSYFQYFLLISLILLVVDFFISSSRNKKNLGSGFAFIFLLLLLPQLSFAQEKNNDIYKGNSLYKKGEYAEAEKFYNKAIKEKKSKTAQYNRANAYAKQDKTAEALSDYEYVGSQSANKKLGSAAYYNAGNLMAKQKKYDEAINYYKAALKKDPSSDKARKNLEFIRKQQQEEKQQKKKDQDKEKEKEKKNPEEEKKEQAKKKAEQEEKEREKEREKMKQQAQASKLSKQQAQKILDALSREEKKLKENKEKKKSKGRALEKDW